MNNLGKWASTITRERPRGKLLLVEDDPVHMVWLRDYFTFKGYEVLPVQPVQPDAGYRSGKQKWRQVDTLQDLADIMTTEKPDHVLTDQHFGDAVFNGSEVMKLAHRLLDVPIVMHTGSVRHQVMADGDPIMPKEAAYLPHTDALLQGKSRGLSVIS